MRHFNIFNYKGVSESREVAWGPKDPPPGVIGLSPKTFLTQKVFLTQKGF